MKKDLTLVNDVSDAFVVFKFAMSAMSSSCFELSVYWLLVVSIQN